MSDQFIFRNIDGMSFRVRTTGYGEPKAEVVLVLDSGDTEFVTPPLSNVQLGVLAHALARAFFNATGRVAWPVSGPMLVCYEKQQAIEESEHLAWLKDSEDREAAGLHLVFEEQAIRRRLRDLETLRIERAEATPDRLCDCERSANGLGMAGRVCDCDERHAEATLDEPTIEQMAAVTAEPPISGVHALADLEVGHDEPPPAVEPVRPGRRRVV